MFRLSGIRVGRLFGIPIELNPSWFIVLAVVGWTLATGYFPIEFPGRPPWIDAVSGAVTALLFFSSIVVHELSHSLVARRSGVRVERVTLFLFGGVAQLSEEPRSPQTELAMALAGPAMSLAISAACYGAYRGLAAVGASDVLWAPVITLAAVNLTVAVFNLAPGFPMDGGRVLRAFIWWATGDRRASTRAASLVGQGVGLLIAAAGLWALFGGAVQGLWSAALGLFLAFLARRTYATQEPRLRFTGTPVSDLMEPTTAETTAELEPSSLIDARESLDMAVRIFSVTGSDELVVVAGDRVAGRLARRAVAQRLETLGSAPGRPRRGGSSAG